MKFLKGRASTGYMLKEFNEAWEEASTGYMCTPNR